MRLVFFLTMLAVLCAAPRAVAAPAWHVLAGPDQAPEAIAPIDAPFPMPELARPVFPDRRFDIRDYGAVGDGKTKNTAAIAGAIRACAEAGGGRVVVPAGVWLTGGIRLESNVNLRLEAGARLRFSDDPADYLPPVFTRWAGFECWNYAPLIYALDCDNIAITGPGAIDGNGRPWWPWAERQADTALKMYHEQVLEGVPPEQRVYGTVAHGLRPQLISPARCTNVLLEGFTIAEPGPFWTVDLVYCDRVIARKLRILTGGGPNTDGLNVDSSTNVLIEHCFFDTGDDCICMKSGMNEDGWRVGRPTENVVIRYNFTQQGHGGAVFGSDTSGGIRNVYVHHCVFNGTDVGVRLKSTRGRGGVVEDIWCAHIDMQDIRKEAVQLTTAYRAWMATTEGRPPRFRRLHFSHIRAREAGEAARIEGLPEAPIEDLRFEDVDLGARKGFNAKLVQGLRLDGVSLDVEEGPALTWTDCPGFEVDGAAQAESGTRAALRP